MAPELTKEQVQAFQQLLHNELMFSRIESVFVTFHSEADKTYEKQKEALVLNPELRSQVLVSRGRVSAFADILAMLDRQKL